MGVAFKGYEEVVAQLLDAGAAVDTVNVMGATALIYAATFKHVNITKMLLEKGANMQIKDARGNTALDHAKLQEMPELVALLEQYS